MPYTSAASKASAVARMYLLAGVPPEPLGPGSKEKRSALEALGQSVGIDIREVRSKHRCAEVLAEALGVEWDTSCRSAGDTITLVGMNRLVDAAASRRVSQMPSAQALSLVERLLKAGLFDPRQAPTEQEAQMPHDLVEVEQNIADYLARLSETGPSPEDFTASPVPFAPGDVRFDDGTWRQRVAEVQAWLYLSTALDESSPDMFDSSLADALGVGQPASREVLLDSLALRLDKALALREEFNATMDGAVEGTATLTSATIAWADAWDTAADDDGIEQSGSIDAEAGTWPIASFAGYAGDDELNLSPSYQRADVWPTSVAQKLIESIVRGIPLPSVIILERDGEAGTEYEVVDGKQRLTSILRFMGKHPHAIEVVAEKSIAWGVADLRATFETDYPRFRELWNHHEMDRLTAETERKNHFPFPLRSTDTADDRNPLTGDLSKLRGRYYCQVREEVIPLQGKDRRVSYIFERGDTTYRIPVITYKSVTDAQVHEVFSLYNKQGKHLNAEEIRNALYHRLDLMKALLVTAGDTKAVKEVAPFLADDWDDLRSTAENLTRYAFGDIGYKRSKVLSWVTAALLLDDAGQDGITRSTTTQINALLQRVSNDRRDPLRKAETVRQLMLLIDHALDAHATPDDVWTKEFRSGNSRGAGKWQELRLVASMIALAAAAAVLDDDLIDVFEDAAPAVRSASASWGKPRRNQSKEQWKWIGFVVREILTLLDVEPADAHAALEKRFGSSGLRVLVEHAEGPAVAGTA